LQVFPFLISGKAAFSLNKKNRYQRQAYGGLSVWIHFLFGSHRFLL